MNRLIRWAAVIATAVALTAFGGQAALAASPAGTPAQAISAVVPAADPVTLHSHGWKSGPAGAHSFEVAGSSQVSTSCGIITCTALYKNSHSDTYWWGANPVNAKQINASLKWWITGVNINFSLPPGAGFSRVTGGVLWKPGAVSNTWHVHLSYSSGVGIKATVIFSVFYSDQADILLGSSWYHVQGNS